MAMWGYIGLCWGVYACVGLFRFVYGYAGLGRAVLDYDQRFTFKKLGAVPAINAMCFEGLIVTVS